MIERFEGSTTPEGEPPRPPEEEYSPEQRWQELLRQGKGWDAIQYYLARDWLRDEDIWDALDAVEEAENRAFLEGNVAEYDRLQEEYERILTWRLGGEAAEEKKFQQYQEDLDLTPEDLGKAILDVGSGSAKFAKWAKDHGISSQIYSLDPDAEMGERTKSVLGKSEALPFKSESFDLVISHSVIPWIFAGIEDPEVLQGKLRQTLTEMLRVTKQDGEVRLGRIFGVGVNEPQRRVRSVLNEVLNELRAEPNLAIQEIPHGEIIYARDAESHPTLKDQEFILRMHKL